MIKNFLISLTIFFWILSPSVAYAQDSQVIARPRDATASVINKDKKADTLKDRASLEITRRLTSLMELKNKVGSIKGLSLDQKTALTGELQTQVDMLTALRTKIDAELDPTMLKVEVKSIVDEYRIYALYLPRVHVLVAAGEILHAVDLFNNLSSLLQTKLTTSDNVALQNTLADMQVRVKNAMTLAQSATVSAMPLTPEGYPGNLATLKNARKNLQTARTELVAARKDATEIIQGLLGGPKNATPSSGSAIKRINLSTNSATTR